MKFFSPPTGTRISRQKGVAIITAMLIVALGTITVVAITNRQQLDLQRERNEALIQTARSFAISGERFASVLLFRDREDGQRENSDSFDDDWAQTIPPIPVDDMSLQGCIVDMQGRFNLNNLVNEEGVADEIQVGILNRLFAELNIDQAKSQAIIDWVDTDLNPTIPDGAEDDYYSGLSPAYRSTNGSFVSVSELQLVKGFSSAVEEENADYKLLLPHIAVLPVTNGPTPVNVNTATPEVISSLSEFLQPLGADLSRWDTGAYDDYPECENIFDLDAEAGPETLEEERDLTPYESVLLFEDEAAPESGEEVAPPGTLTVQSRYFQVRIDVAGENVALSQYTLMERLDDGRTTVLFRARDTL